jgi:hypothetical protein
VGKTGQEQEIAHLQKLPGSVQEYYVQKGLLYTALKIINDASAERHAEHADRAAAYNLKILTGSWSVLWVTLIWRPTPSLTWSSAYSSSPGSKSEASITNTR